MTEGLVNMDLVVQILTDRGVPAVLEQTGGGTATIFAGATHDDPEWGDRYEACAGPGHWTHGWGNPDPANTAVGYLGEFCVGPDDFGENGYWMTGAEDTEHTIAERIAALCT
jgi:hypothetical protein